MHPDVVTWQIVLTTCQKGGHLDLAMLAFEHAVRLDEKVVATYVSMSNIYADVDVRLLTMEYDVDTTTGYTFINKISSFVQSAKLKKLVF